MSLPQISNGRYRAGRVLGINLCLVLLAMWWPLAAKVTAQAPTETEKRKALVTKIEELKKRPIKRLLETKSVKLEPAMSNLSCERTGYGIVTKTRNRAWEFSVDAVLDSASGKFYVGFQCDCYVKVEAGIAGINFGNDGFTYVLPSWLAEQKAVANHEEAWKAFEEGLKFPRLEAAEKEKVHVGFPAAIFMAHSATSAPGLPVEIKKLVVKGQELTIAFLAKNTGDTSILKIDTSTTPWRITSAMLNGIAVDVKPLDVFEREEVGIAPPAATATEE